jgi:hypothetical protein
VLDYLMYRFGFLPQQIPMSGVIGGPLTSPPRSPCCSAPTSKPKLRTSSWIPEIALEASITIYTIVKGLRPSPILDDTRYGRVAEASLSPAGAAP